MVIQKDLQLVYLIGGHCAPNSTLGDIALWKNAQKIAKKKNTSEIINKPTPKFNPFCTALCMIT